MLNMNTRSPREIRHDIRACWHNAAIGHEMGDKDVEDHFIREAKAYERELEFVKTGGLVLTTA